MRTIYAFIRERNHSGAKSVDAIFQAKNLSVCDSSPLIDRVDIPQLAICEPTPDRNI